MIKSRNIIHSLSVELPRLLAGDPPLLETQSELLVTLMAEEGEGAPGDGDPAGGTLFRRKLLLNAKKTHLTTMCCGNQSDNN